MEIGERINDWTCLGDSGRRYSKYTKIYKWQCVCGRIKEAALACAHNTKHCADCRGKARWKYGLPTRDLPLYNIWRSMYRRCYNKKHGSYKYYGARGIKMCDRWHNYDNFSSDMGERPTGMQLDRINSDGNYEPSNCRWATTGENIANRRCCLKYSDKYVYRAILRADLCSECRTRLAI